MVFISMPQTEETEGGPRNHSVSQTAPTLLE